MAQRGDITRGQIFAAEDGLVLIEDYHFGENVAYEYATQMWLDQAGQMMMIALLDVPDMPDPQALSQLLKDRFQTFEVARQFADDHNIPYEIKTDMQP